MLPPTPLSIRVARHSGMLGHLLIAPRLHDPLHTVGSGAQSPPGSKLGFRSQLAALDAEAIEEGLKTPNNLG